MNEAHTISYERMDRALHPKEYDQPQPLWDYITVPFDDITHDDLYYIGSTPTIDRESPMPDVYSLLEEHGVTEQYAQWLEEIRNARKPPYDRTHEPEF